MFHKITNQLILISNEKDNINNGYENKIASTKSTFYISVIIVSVVCLLASLICFFVNAKNKKDRIYKYIQENGNNMIFKIFTIFNLSFVVLILIGLLTSMKIVLDGMSTYYTFASILETSYIALIIPIVSILVGYLITSIKIKKA